ncbi:MAG: glycosyl transferase family 2 [Candidatus Levybacteria bacterium RIFCSPHIGHO2_02_FULL_37_13]|nr:MAG: glycosyl transferase family 2 [Candidatus Levybacteria bacterium RIFCSPHIGHO2_02_FULL_37_13]OGH30731.1 MAG: glycosyl transferase family 2 [Candidatus Levybacteria bacterium RIFCSPHIGHO2_12_FULL_37_9]OGH37936.1 MAG: glycosyl transferase family 2 [Candidatus Levybacteria bacterium RIFCSPLOWO2_01_FULL_37_26]
MTSINNKDWELPNFDIIEFGPKKTKYCVGIPVINEGEKFKKQIIEMKKYSHLADIVIFDGGSTDGSTNQGFLKKNSARTLLMLKGFGKQGTQLRMGLSYAIKQGYEGVITVDGNGKDDVKAIPQFIKSLDDGFDYTQGSRFIKGGKAIHTPLIRFFAIRFVHAPIISLGAKHWYTDTTNGFRAYSKKYLLSPNVKPFRNIFVKYELYLYLSIRANRLGFKTKEIPVTRGYPKGTVPTKIHGLKSYFDFLSTTIKTALGYYNP